MIFWLRRGGSIVNGIRRGGGRYCLTPVESSPSISKKM